ncbi:DR2241 family protein [Halococcus agarilyticus]|uniref:DR2241 family protein n=1 Tax=Halococcus agarilyticus TaxID=1232219 RepID=UPI000677EDD0|nr:DR2241 family protein [Halococcus agarilyticus]
MNDAQLHALREAATDGVSCDGLRAERTEDGYTFATPEATHEGLDEAGFDALAEANPWLVSNWHVWADASGARAAYCRWIERADDLGVRERYEALVEGLSREWGQLLVTAELGEDGGRVYELRHVDDANAEPDALALHDDPLDAREIATLDADGRYRPLKTAPTLQRGWRFAALDGRDLVRTVEFFYPATVANWQREREGDLDVTHFRETAERQTGIYDVVDELDPEGVENLARACCVDSQCLKRREWDEDDEAELDAPRGDGEFPCREPCSLVIAAARQWAILESEDSRTYEFELTPSEKTQLEEIVGAVAEGRTDEIREADVGDGANRYRARYLRAKLTDEDGSFENVSGGQ